ncbi:DUF2254 domain-containing protein [Psychroflexus aestuariivivens]|uniref:DUF2254 domain-containing protein n=1 Tax=Psychroflexus aestuariivivens TaxID=1795040 RepID=UPI000FD9D06D|nr:DUF2254 domain-containing protein [Psychroflexus aestuariivivens]
MKKLAFIWSELTNSFWFIPILIILCALGLSAVSIYLDQLIDFNTVTYFKYFVTESADSARSVLSTISGAMIGVAGTVFSITLVALTLASSQFGSRLLRNFMHERLNQVVLGIYVSTYLYCLIILNVVKDNDGMQFIPSLSILISIFAAVANIVLLIVFIHHISVSIQADNVISDISESLTKNVEFIFSEEIEEDSISNPSEDVEAIIENYSKHTTVKSSESGYLQYMQNETLLNFAIENNILIITKHRPGNYLVKGEKIFDIYTNSDIDQEAISNLNSNFITGKSRTPQQDAEHAIHQMVEIACRALSPGINDPYTAITCIDNLTSTMCYLTKVKFPEKYRYDDDGNLRYVLRPLTYEGMLNTSFLQIRQFSKGSPAVVIRLMEAMITIYQFTKFTEHQKVVCRHAQMILDLAESSFEDDHDLKDMKERSQIIFNNN